MTATKGLLVDFGGVLTASVGHSFRRFERAARMPEGTVIRLLREAYDNEDDGPIARFERGEMELDQFEAELGGLLRVAGYGVDHEGIVNELFGGMIPDEDTWGLVRRARAAGVRTGLLSNSWGVDDYPRERFDDHFDAVVISGEEGVRKPSPEIFLLAVDRVGVPADRCAFVDDLDRNVEAARELGMFAILHRSADATAEQLEGFLGVPLA